MISDIQAAKNILHELAVQTYSLGMGLQSAAPPQHASEPAKAVQYLLAVSILLEQTSHSVGSKNAE